MGYDVVFMEAAIEEAKAAFAEGEVPVGAVIVRKGTVIARSHNVRERTRDPLGHAELLAIKNASALTGDWRLEESEIYVTLEPCPMCAGAIMECRMKRLIFGAFDEKIGAAGSSLNLLDYPGLGRSIPVKSGVCEEECKALLKEFFDKKRSAVHGEMAEFG
jgi:tRNA(adenine34) deaminase